VRLLAVGNMYPPHHLGGYELAWQGATDHLRATGHDVRVLTTETRLPGVEQPDAPWVARGLRWYWRDHAWPRMSPRAVVALERANHRTFARHVAEHRPDAVLWWSMGGMSLSLIRAARRAGLPSVAFVHDHWPVYGPRVDRWTALARRWRLPAYAPEDVGRWAFVSEHIRAACGDPPNAEVASSGIDPAFLDPRPERPWRWRLLYAGRIDPRKGIEAAIAALDHLPEEATLTVVGAGEAPPTAGPRVTFAGAHDAARLREDYAEADAVLFPVLWDEPWGLVPLEAMGMGRPVIATGRGGSGEYLRDGENALLVPAGDAAALAAAVRRLAADAALRDRLREGGAATARAHTRDGFHRRVEEVVAGLLRR
jgi:glycosyltransferase involved in cell wall biosynthesis